MIGLVDGNNFFVSCERVINPKLNGRPVAVLSNNDGCCVALSPELKALGVTRGTPYFQLKDREYPRGEIIFLSSNFELYGDLSRRIIQVLRLNAVEVEQYSIDEAFIHPPSNLAQSAGGNGYLEYGRRLRTQILQWVGIPCGIGFAPTKTLAKIANHLGKKSPDGVFVMPNDPSDILAGLPVGDVWGVGRRLPVKLQIARIRTAKDLRDAPEDVIRSVGGTALLRTALELRGIVCNDNRDYDSTPESITCSRTFGEKVTNEEALRESLATFAAQAATKLRQHGQLAAGCNIYAQIAERSDHGAGPFIDRTVVFPEPTDETHVMLKAIREHVHALFRQSIQYRKSGVVFFGLEKAGGIRQLDLFSSKINEASKLYQTIDALNKRYGRSKVHCASEGMGEKSWQMKRSKVSPRATTNWDELIKVR